MPPATHVDTVLALHLRPCSCMASGDGLMVESDHVAHAELVMSDLEARLLPSVRIVCPARPSDLEGASPAAPPFSRLSRLPKRRVRACA